MGELREIFEQLSLIHPAGQRTAHLPHAEPGNAHTRLAEMHGGKARA